MTEEGNRKLSLTKIIPAHKKTILAQWCQREFGVMSSKFRAFRANVGGRVNMNSCYWCKRPHLDGEMMALASFVRLGNRTLCQKCAKELIEGTGGED